MSFTAAVSNGMPITNYTVSWNPKGGVDENAGSASIAHTVTGLKNGTSYTFAVTATNAKGTGPSSHSIRVTPATTPDAPTIMGVNAGKKQATVKFTLPAKDDGGDPVTSYIVTPYIGATAEKTTSGTQSPITVTGLTSGQPYTFTVTAKNKMGTGTPSAFSNPVEPK